MDQHCSSTDKLKSTESDRHCSRTEKDTRHLHTRLSHRGTSTPSTTTLTEGLSGVPQRRLCGTFERQRRKHSRAFSSERTPDPARRRKSGSVTKRTSPDRGSVERRRQHPDKIEDSRRDGAGASACGVDDEGRGYRAVMWARKSSTSSDWAHEDQPWRLPSNCLRNIDKSHNEFPTPNKCHYTSRTRRQIPKSKDPKTTSRSKSEREKRRAPSPNKSMFGDPARRRPGHDDRAARPRRPRARSARPQRRTPKLRQELEQQPRTAPRPPRASQRAPTCPSGARSPDSTRESSSPAATRALQRRPTARAQSGSREPSRHQGAGSPASDAEARRHRPAQRQRARSPGDPPRQRAAGDTPCTPRRDRTARSTPRRRDEEGRIAEPRAPCDSSREERRAAPCSRRVTPPGTHRKNYTDTTNIPYQTSCENASHKQSSTESCARATIRRPRVRQAHRHKNHAIDPERSPERRPSTPRCPEVKSGSPKPTSGHLKVEILIRPLDTSK